MDDDNSNFLMGEGMAGVEANRKVASSSSRPLITPRKHTDEGLPPRPSAKKPDYVGDAKRSIYQEWAEKPPVDPKAQVLCLDPWGRKVELHDAGWEHDNHVTRYFSDGEVLTSMTGVMQGTLRDIPYIKAFNSEFELARFHEAIRDHGVEPKSAPGSAVHIPAGYKVAVMGRGDAKTVTIGYCPMYEVVVVDGPLKGLRLLKFPDGMVNEAGVNGYGMKDVQAKPANVVSINTRQ